MTWPLVTLLRRIPWLGAHFRDLKPARVLVGFAFLTAVAVLGATGLILWNLHGRELARAEREVTNVRELLTEQTERTLQAVGLVLRGTRDRLREAEASGYLVEPKAVHTLFRARIDGMPQIRFLSLVDSGGQLAVTSRQFPAPPLGLGDRGYFAFHRDRPDSGVQVGQPLRSRFDDRWALPMTVRLDGRGGQFGGVIVASVDLAYFEQFYQSIDLGPGGEISLYLQDGTLLARYPRGEEALGRSFADSLVFRALQAEKEGARHGLVRGEEGGERRIVAYGGLQGLPLIVAASMSEDTVLGDWRHQALLIYGGAAGVVLVLILAALALGRELKRDEVLTHELRESHRQLRELSASLQTVREEEQARIARELHDELGQHLTGLKMDLAWLAPRVREEPALAAKIEGMKQLIDATVVSVRRIASELRPTVLDDLGLTPAVEWLANDFAKRSAMRVVTDMDDIGPGLDGRLATAAFRIVQESLTNVARHSGAGSVNVSLKRGDGRLTVEVQDDGRGMLLNTAGGKRSFGLIGMRERAHMFGGHLNVISEPGKGTTVRAVIPVPEQATQEPHQ